jgi:transcriptional regulator with XRE-family HTH domain
MSADRHLSQHYPAAPPPEPIKIINARIASRLAECRQARNLTGEDLGRLVGVCGARISDYESGVKEIPASMLFELAGVLKVSLEYFCDEVN